MFGEYPPFIEQHTESHVLMEGKGDKVNLSHVDMPVGVLIPRTKDNIITLIYDID